MVSRLRIGHLILIFALVALPVAATFASYYPDERHYTDGAMYMLQHGEWLSPHNGANSLRFEKPILAYWAVAASWLVLGVNTLTARLPFLLVSCGTLCLTYRLAKRITGSAQTAFLAAVILASQPVFFLSAVRNIPDALLTFFVALSAYGFLRLIVWEEWRAGAYWMAYAGAAGAALSKGLLGVGIVVFCWGFAFFYRRENALKKLWHWPSVMTSLALVAGWFVYILIAHGSAAWKAFLGDQVTGNVGGHVWEPPLRVPAFALTALINFLPWSLMIVEGVCRQKKFSGGTVAPVVRNFILIWTATLAIGFSLGTNISVRYMLPAAPLMSILLADWLTVINEGALIFNLRRILYVFTGLGCVLGGLIVLMAFEWHVPLLAPTLVAILLVALVIALAKLAGRNQLFSRPEALGLTILAMWLMFMTAVIPILPSDSGIQTADVLKKFPGKPQPVAVINDMELANRLRIRLGRGWTVIQSRKIDRLAVTDYKYFVLRETEAQVLANKGWRVREISVEPRISSLRELWRAIETRTVPEFLDGTGNKIFLAMAR